MTTLREARRQLQAARVTMTVSALGIQSHPYDGGRWVPWDAADDIVSHVAEAECAALRGQRDVLALLLAEASHLLNAIPIDGTCESVIREGLLDEIDEACMQLAAERMAATKESTHG